MLGVSVRLPGNGVSNGESDLRASVEIYYLEHPQFGLILSSQNDPLLRPQFHPPPCGQLAAPFLPVHKSSGPKFRLCTHKKVSGHDSYPLSHWPCPGWA